MNKFSPIAFLLGPLLLAACGVDQLDDSMAMDCVNDGKCDGPGVPTSPWALDKGDLSVVALSAYLGAAPGFNPAFGGLCTASVISPTALLTAAHCLSPVQPPGLPPRPVSVAIYLGSDDTHSQATDWLPASAFYFDPEFDWNHLYNGHDIGLVIMAQPLGLPALPILSQTPPASLVGHRFKVVGYGLTGETAVDDGLRRIGVTILRSITSLVLNSRGGAGLCHGDSGGPLFATLNGVETVIGVASGASQPCGTWSRHTRIDNHQAFIREYVTDLP